MAKQVGWLVARGLRAFANRLDPEPPHMREALRLLGWVWDGAHWCYHNPFASSKTNTLTDATYTVVWQPGGEEGKQ